MSLPGTTPAPPAKDTRSRAFAPPSQLRKTRPSASETGQLESRPSQHTRTSSFFSFSSKKSAQQQAQQATEVVQQRPPPSLPSASGHVQSPSVTSITHTRRPSIGMEASPSSPNPAVQREIKSVVDLALAHVHKIYYSGPLVRRIERAPDGNRPTRDAGWVDVWAQLGGTTLSVWDMKAIEEASKRGAEVPPSYINVTDSFIQVLGALTSPATPTAPAKRYTNVITLNTAGSNLILFACPSSEALIAWASALRLAGWEKSRLEEIYTGHLLRMSLSEGEQWKEPATTLVRGRLEGQVKVRVAGQTDWKPLWMVLSSSNDVANATTKRPTSPTTLRSKNRMSNLFSRGQSPPPPPSPVIPVVSMYASPKPKDRKKPILTMRYVSQAYAVYPERPEAISRSTLMKIEGLLGDEEMAGIMKGKECWLMLMPETEQSRPVFELLKWLVAFHDAYSLYGRPNEYVWDPRQPPSMWFAYPVGPQRANLFFDRELAEKLDPRDDRTSVIRRDLKQILVERMYGPLTPPGSSPPQLGKSDSTQLGQSQAASSQNENEARRPGGAPILPPIQTMGSDSALSTLTPQLPPLNFNGAQPQPSRVGQEPRPIMSRGSSSLTPITEGSPIDTVPSGTIPESSHPSSVEPQRTFSGELPRKFSGDSAPKLSGTSPSLRSVPERQGSGGILDEPIVKSPVEELQSPPMVRRSSEDSYPGSRPDSKLGKSSSYASTGKAPSEKPPPAVQSSAERKSPAATQSQHPSIPPTPASYTVSPPAPGSPLRSQDTLPSPHSAAKSQSPTSGTFQPSAVRSEGPLSPAPEQTLFRRSPTPHAQAIASPGLPNPHSPAPDIFSNPHSPVPQAGKSDTSLPLSKTPSDANTPVVINREWPQPPQKNGTSSPPPHPQPQLQSQTRSQSHTDLQPRPSPHLSRSRPQPSAGQNLDLASEPGALYLLQQRAEQAPGPSRVRDAWATDEEDEEGEEDGEDTDYSGPERNPPPRRGGTPDPLVPVRVQTPMSYRLVEAVSESQINSYGASRSSLGRKPSGARAKPSYPTRRYPDAASPLEPVAEPQAGPSLISERAMEQSHSQSSTGYDDHADALAALTFLESHEDAASRTQKPPVPAPSVEGNEPSLPSDDNHHYRSSFAPSKQAAERKAKAQAQQEASYAATHMPGKPNGKAKDKKKDPGAWAESSDEEEEEEEEEEEDGSDDEASVPVRQPQPLPASDPRASVYPSAQPGYQAASSSGQFMGQRQARTLPMPPGPGGSSQDQNPHGRGAPSQYDDRPRTHIGDEPRGHTVNPHQAARQSVWSTVLDPQPPPRNTSRKDTFVQVDQNETMTKAFQPQGLLSAGLQDKEDRSAKRQEELARETGASLINVPNKPPPPQTGLLGAITAHERERKREGGVGAALTEKERERRLAEERQRKLDDLQRQQLDQLSQGGGPAYDPYGQQQFPGYGQNFDPRMSMNPMMLNPYMAGGFPMMPFGNPQQMMAAQLAAQQAYQQAMLSFSQAGGSQAGDNVSRVGAQTPMGSPGLGPTSPMQGGMMGTPPPMGTPPLQGGMMGMDPRMTMMSPMGMMMGGGMGMNPMMGMGMGQNFDPRMTMAPTNYMQLPESGPGRHSSYQGTPSPRQGSPAPPHSGNNSPRPHP